MPHHHTEDKKAPKKFKSKFDASMSVLYKTQLEKRRDSRVHIIRHKSKNKFSARKENGELTTLKPGRYAYITIGGKITAWPIISAQHNDTCHFALSDFAQLVDYAGEVTFSKYRKRKAALTIKGQKETNKPEESAAQCDLYDNASGTYKPEEAFKAQSGFPEEKFVRPNFSY